MTRRELTVRRPPNPLVALTFLALGLLTACDAPPVSTLDGQPATDSDSGTDGGLATDKVVNAPTGWTATLSRRGVQCFRRSSGEHQICAADLRLATAKTVHGTINSTSPVGERTFRLTSFTQHWDGAAGLESGTRRRAFAVNLSFFSRASAYSGLAFAYKTEGVLHNYGYESGAASHQGKLRILSIWPDRQYADIGPHSNDAGGRAALTSWGSAPIIVGGVDISDPAYRPASTTTPRTMVGVADTDRSGSRETLLVYSGVGSTATGDGFLRAFGADRTMNVDGGSSWAFRTATSTGYGGGITLPNALVVVDGG